MDNTKTIDDLLDTIRKAKTIDPKIKAIHGFVIYHNAGQIFDYIKRNKITTETEKHIYQMKIVRNSLKELIDGGYQT